MKNVRIGANLSAALQAIAERNQHRIFGVGAIRSKIERDKKAWGCSDRSWSSMARSKYAPHQGKRECARRVRQREKLTVIQGGSQAA